MIRIRKMLILFGVLLLCLAYGRSVNAEETLQIGIDQYEVVDNKFLIYVNHNGGVEFTPSVSESSLLIGKQTLDIEEVQSFSEVEEPISFLCLIDISGSMTQENIERCKEILKQFVAVKGKQDNICIAAMGNNITSSGFLTDADRLTEAIDGIELTREDTNLYHSIKEEINVLQTDKAVHKKRCLVIFSDGADDQTVGITKEEAETVVKESHIPIFTVAMLRDNPKDAEVESAKILGSFARYSAGGKYYAPLVDESEYSEICDDIYTTLQTSLVVRAGLEDIVVGDETVYIELELADGTKKAKDGITIPAGNISEAIKEAQQEQESKITVIKETTTISEQGEDTAEDEPEKQNYYFLLGIGFLLLVLIIAVILILSRKSSKKRYEEDEDWDADRSEERDESGSVFPADHAYAGDYSVINISDDRRNTMAPENAADKNPDANLSAETKPHKRKSKIEVTLYRVGPGEEESYHFTIKNEISIGRNKSCQLSFEKDSALSGVHCSIVYRDGSVFVRDEESTNGTYVNGVPIVGEYKVELDDILLLGSSEYRIVWE